MGAAGAAIGRSCGQHVRCPLWPARSADECAVLVRRAQLERGAGTAVVEHFGNVGNLDGRAEVRPQTLVTIADHLLQNGMTAPALSLVYALNREHDGDQDHVQMHEVAGVRGVRNELKLARVREHGF